MDTTTALILAWALLAEWRAARTLALVRAALEVLRLREELDAERARLGRARVAYHALRVHLGGMVERIRPWMDDEHLDALPGRMAAIEREVDDGVRGP